MGEKPGFNPMEKKSGFPFSKEIKMAALALGIAVGGGAKADAAADANQPLAELHETALEGVAKDGYIGKTNYNPKVESESLVTNESGDHDASVGQKLASAELPDEE